MILNGGPGDDSLLGTIDADELYGFAGNDTLGGGDGDDGIEGGDGDDGIEGGDGDDRLFGGIGNDSLYAGVGNDRLWGGDGDDLLETHGGQNSLFGEAGNDVLFSNEGANILDGGNGNDGLISYTGADTLSGGLGTDYFRIEFSNIQPVWFAPTIRATITDFESNEKLSFPGLGKVLTSELVISALPGGGVLIQADADRNGTYEIELSVLTGSVNDPWFIDHSRTGEWLVFGSSSGVGLTASNPNYGELLQGRMGDDTLSGLGQDDTLYGDNGSDILNGGGGDDTLYAGGGDDTITGGAGADQFVIENAAGHIVFTDFIAGPASGDRLNLDRVFDSKAAALAAAAQVGANVVFTISPSLTVTLQNVQLTDLVDEDIYVDFEVVSGTNGDDVSNNLTGTILSDQIFGFDGNDSLLTGFGLDSLFGGNGDDALGIAGPVYGAYIDGGVGSDTYSAVSTTWVYDVNLDLGLVYPTAAPYLSATLVNIENVKDVYGGTLSKVTGTNGDNRLQIGASGNTIFGLGGNDYIEAGPATFNNDSDYVDGGAGDDTIYGELIDFWVNLPAFPTRDTVYGGDGDDVIHGMVDADMLFGDAGNDQIWGGQNADWIDGGADNDQINGDNIDALAPFGSNSGSHADTIWGGDGDDTVFGNADGDYLYGSAGFDILDGGADNDRMLGGLDSDTLIGDGGDDTLRGEDGNDQLFAGPGKDRADGGLGDDLVRTSNGRDTLLGGDGNDTLGAGSGNDLLNGNAGADLLLASNGDDRLLGGDGNDTMQGGGGRDTLTGGAGDDRLVGGTENDRFNFAPGSGADLIVDFGAGAASGDVIGLIGFGAAFDTFAEVLAVSTQAGANVVIDLGGGDSITLQGVTLANLNANDFAFA